jgi:signal transduction histidine kinase
MARTTVEELRSLFLFASLDDDQLAWLAERADKVAFDAGATVFRQGEEATHLYVLLDGAVRMARTVNGEDLTVNETAHRGAYAGATRAYVEQEDPYYANTLVTRDAASFVRISGPDFAEFMHAHFPMAIHLLDGLYNGLRNSEGAVQQREHLARLGTFSATLAHELNNPAAAAVRATGQLRGRVAGMRSKLAMIASGRLDSEVLARLVVCQERAVELAAKARSTPRSPMEEADLEDAFSDRLDELGIAGAYDLAPVFAGSGLTVAWLDDVVDNAGPGSLEGAVRWLAYTLETESLMDEIEDSTSRISTLVASVKQYSYVDSASVQDVDVHVGLDSTVLMLGHKLQGTRVVREFDRSLPAVPMHAAEINQVWTNLIDNAADAMGGTGTLTLRTRAEGDELLVEVADDGPGIPAAVAPRVFEALFTTKPPGSGSGLGLDSAQRIVVSRHHGSIDFVTGPDGTCFQVRLPLRQQLT